MGRRWVVGLSVASAMSLLPLKSASAQLCPVATLAQYIANSTYTGPTATGCTIGGASFQNFNLFTLSSIISGPIPVALPTAASLLLTPVNYVKNGQRWVGFRFTNGNNKLEMRGGSQNPVDYSAVDQADHDAFGWGFQQVADIRFEVHGQTNFQSGKVGYAGLETKRTVNGVESTEACYSTVQGYQGSPCASANLGFRAANIGAQGYFGGLTTHTLINSDAWARLATVTKGQSNLVVPDANENAFAFLGAGVKDFHVRNTYFDSAPTDVHATYGFNTRMNRHTATDSRWKVDYLEYSFTAAQLTPAVVTPDPSTVAMLAVGLGLGLLVRRRTRSS